LNSIYKIKREISWEKQRKEVYEKLLPPLMKKINKKYKVPTADLVKMLQRRHRSRRRKQNIVNQGPESVIRESRRTAKNTAMSDVSSFFLIYKLIYISGTINIYLYFNRRKREERRLLII